MTAPIKSAKEIARRLVSYLNDRDVCYAILGDTSKFPEIETDLDVCTRDARTFLKALYEFCKSTGISVLNIHHHATGIRCDIGVVSPEGRLLALPGPDILLFPTWRIRGFIGLSYRDLLESRIRGPQGFFVPSKRDAFMFYLVKRIDKGELTDKQAGYLSQVWRQESSLIQQSVLEIWPDELGTSVTEAAKSGDWEKTKARLPALRRALKARAQWSKARAGWIFNRLFRRLFTPAGLFIAVLGPDGSGKSSVLDRLQADLSPVFRHTARFHLKPGFVSLRKSTGGPVVDPHGQPPRGMILSVMKIFYFCLDYLLGYLRCVWPVKIRNGLIIFDRYYHDLIVDPRRYRYGGPMWLARLAAKFVPKPDLWIVLDAPAEVLQARKQEVTFEETGRQRQAYLDLMKGFDNAVVADASQPLDDVVADVNAAVVACLAGRTRKRLGL